MRTTVKSLRRGGERIMSRARAASDLCSLPTLAEIISTYLSPNEHSKGTLGVIPTFLFSFLKQR